MIIYLEILYSLLTNNTISIISVISAVILTIIIHFIKSSKIKTIILLFIYLIFIIYFIYFNLFGNNLNISIILNAHQAIKFGSLLINKINILEILLFSISLVILYFEIKFYKKNNRISIISLIVLIILYYGLIFTDNKAIYSNYNLYFKIQNNNENVKSFGLLISIKLDVFKTIFNFKDSYITNYELSKICNNDEICEISNYLGKKEQHKLNDYTGIFEGKNLIIFLAESFYPIGVDEEITPTLYKLVHEGFEFSNYYTPTYLVATADSQYILDTSLLPSEAVWTMESSVNNNFIYNYPHVLNDYKTYSYHNYDYDYYDRDKYMENMGYDVYLACGNGLEERMDCTKGQNSDLEMIQATIDDYINEDNFLVYYTTMSGHANYDSNSPMVVKNYDAVKNLPYSENVKNYIATQVELDKALEYLVDTLKEKGKLEDTVILLSGDHPPYTLDLSSVANESNNEMENVFSYYKSNLIIYNSTIEHQTIDKTCSTLDVLPTMLNLFGIKYDSRLLMGTDIFSEDEGIVIFNNRSFIYNNVYYNRTTNNFYKGSLDSTELEQVQEKIYEMYHYSRLILETDYYNYID